MLMGASTGRALTAAALAALLGLGACRTNSDKVQRWATTAQGPRKLVAVLTHEKYPLDLRVDVPLGKTGLCGDPKTVDLGVAGAKILFPSDPAKSTLALRMRALDDNRMPKLGSRVVDEAAVKVVEEWIRALPACN